MRGLRRVESGQFQTAGCAQSLHLRVLNAGLRAEGGRWRGAQDTGSAAGSVRAFHTKLLADTGKSLNLAEPQFHHLPHGADIFVKSKQNDARWVLSTERES